jgi:hypothetical protein
MIEKINLYNKCNNINYANPNKENSYVAKVVTSGIYRFNVDIQAENGQVTHQGMKYFGGYVNSWAMVEPGNSFFRIDTTFYKDPSKTYLLNLLHGIAMPGVVKEGTAPKITIRINNEVYKGGHTLTQPDNLRSAYFHEEFDITGYLVDGQNSITIELDADSSASYYYLPGLTIEQK